MINQQESTLKEDPITGLILPVQRSLIHIRLSDTFMLAAVPLLAYYAQYLYQTGYAKRFGYPPQLIVFDFAGVFSFVETFVQFLVGVLFFAGLLWSFGGWIHKRNAGWAVGLGALVLISPVILQAVLYLPWWGDILTLVTAVSAAISEGRSQKSGRERGLVNRLFQWLEDRLPTSVFMLLLACALTLTIAGGLGYIKAVARSEYYTIPATLNTPELAVLQIQGNRMICAPFDRQTREISQEFRILTLDDVPNLVLKLERGGTLGPPSTPQTLKKQPTFSPIATPIP